MWFAAIVLLAAPARAQLQGENLLVSPPPDFKSGYEAKRPGMVMTEMVPKAETVQNWTEMVTTQVFFQLGGVRPDAYLRDMVEKWRVACPGSVAGPVERTTTNNYPVATVQLRCPRNPGTGKPETTAFRALQGAKTLYLVQYAFRADADAAMRAKAAAFLQTVSVCEAGSARHPCPDLTARGFWRQ